MESAYLGNICANQESAWKIRVSLCSRLVEFKIDTGANVTAIGINSQLIQGKNQLVQLTQF